MSFLAYRVQLQGENVSPGFCQLSVDQLTAGEVVIRSQYSSINYKDALAVTGKGKILRRYPLNAGIDVAGYVESSTDSRFKPGQQVLVAGNGFGEERDGGYSQIVRVPGDHVVLLPQGLTLYAAMAFGTAGFSAALAIHRMLVNGQTPAQGPIVVTGATGGVGSFALAILQKLGFATIALTGRKNLTDYLIQIGATQVSSLAELNLGQRPLEKALFGGCVDNIGGETLAALIRHVNLWGNVACVGLADTHTYHGTVMPLILRGVSLLGVSSNNCTQELRNQLWQRLASDLMPESLDKIVTHKVAFAKFEPYFAKLINREIHGRIVIEF